MSSFDKLTFPVCNVFQLVTNEDVLINGISPYSVIISYTFFYLKLSPNYTKNL